MYVVVWAFGVVRARFFVVLTSIVGAVLVNKLPHNGQVTRHRRELKGRTPRPAVLLVPSGGETEEG